MRSLNQQLAQAKGAERENRQLSNLVHLDDSIGVQSYHPVTAQVIARDPLLWYQTVEVDRGRLVVRGERRDQREDEERGLREVRYGAFRREFALPQQVSGEAVSASYEAGVLSIRVAGAYAGTQPRRVPVTSADTRPAVEA